MPGSDAPALLILGGTAEARDLAAAAVGGFGDRLRVVTSLAGRTREPAAVAGEVRIGGFGGAAAMADALRADGIAMVVDATHPFAAAISANAAEACTAVGVPRLLLHRPPWTPVPEDRWVDAAHMTDVAARLPGLGKRCLVTTGVKKLGALRDVKGVHFLVRVIEPPAEPLPLQDAALVISRPPHGLESERALIKNHAIDVVLTKNSGGPSTAAKLQAAREVGIPVLMIRRPGPPVGDRVETASAALTWIAANVR